MKGMLEPIRYEFYTSFTDLLGAVKNLNLEVFEINDEYIAIAYFNDEDEESIEEVYSLNVIYVNERPSTITIGDLKRRDVL